MKVYHREKFHGTEGRKSFLILKLAFASEITYLVICHPVILGDRFYRRLKTQTFRAGLLLRDVAFGRKWVLGAKCQGRSNETRRSPDIIEPTLGQYSRSLPPRRPVWPRDEPLSWKTCRWENHWAFARLAPIMLSYTGALLHFDQPLWARNMDNARRDHSDMADHSNGAGVTPASPQLRIDAQLASADATSAARSEVRLHGCYVSSNSWRQQDFA